MKWQLLCAALLTFTAHAQEAMYTQAATMPGKNTFVVRQQAHVWQYGQHPLNDNSQTRKYELESSISYGLARAVSVSLDVPVVFEDTLTTDGERDKGVGVEDLDIMFKIRVYRNDRGGVDTLRVAILAGAKVASGDSEEYSSQSVNPHLGAVVTLVRGRWGFNQDITFQHNTGGEARYNFGGEGPDDALFFNTAGLYRIEPARFTSQSVGAWYITAEMNGLYETNGDTELRFAPGLMYEGRSYALEFMGQLPVYDDLDERPELDWAIGVGVRFAF
jgi:hypothetical protein